MNDHTDREIPSRLESWAWPAPRPTRRPFQRMMPGMWRGAVAAALIAAAFLAGFRSAPRPDVAALRSELSRESAAGLIRLSESLEQSRHDDRQMLLAILQKLQTQHRSEFLSLRHDLETVAATADDRLRRTQQNLMLLASDKPARPAP